MPKRIETFFVVLFVSLSVQAKRLISTSGGARVAVLELYSSESCSSCPPADRWVTSYLNDDGKILVNLEGLDKNKKYSVRIARLGLGISHKITSGENSGSELTHDFVVLDWSTHKINGSVTEVSTVLTKGALAHKSEALVAWIESDSQPIPLQATGGML
jgi:hypothetical protein